MQPALARAKSEAVRKMVIPVWYVDGRGVVHTTSSMLTVDGVHLRAPRPPLVGTTIELRLYFPGVAAGVARKAVVAHRTSGANSGFWAEFSDRDKDGADQVAHALAQFEDGRAFPRYATNLAVHIRDAARDEQEGLVKNISGSGAFIEVPALPWAGGLIDLEIAFADGQEKPALVQAYVVHVSDGLDGRGRGMGVQFIAAKEAFQKRLTAYLAARRG